MKGFAKVIVCILAVFGLAIGALAIFDNIKNKNRIKGGYLDVEEEEIIE